MNRRFLRPLILLVTIAVAFATVPFVISPVGVVHAAGTPTVFVAPSFHAAVAAGSTVAFSINVSSMSSFNSFNIFVRTVNGVLHPTSVSTAHIIFASPSTTTSCINNTGTGCVAGIDGVGIVHWGVLCNGCSASGNGLLFNITYTAGSGTPTQTVVDVYNDILKIGSSTANIAHNTVSGFYGSTTIPDFNVSASPFSQSIITGHSSTVNVTLTSVNGFSGTVSLSTTTSGPSTLSVVLNASSVGLSSGGTRFVHATVSPTSTSKGGTNGLMVNASSGSPLLIHPVQVTLIVLIPGFTITPRPSSLAVPLTFSNQSSITLTSLNTFSAKVNVSTTIYPSVINGPVLSLTNSTTTAAFVFVTIPSNGSVNVTLTVATASTTIIDLYTITINVVGGGLSQPSTVNLNVVPFTISANPTSLGTILRGSFATSTITVGSVANFGGIVTLLATIAPTGPDALLSNSTLKNQASPPGINVTLPAGGLVTATLNVTTTISPPTPTRDYVITLEGRVTTVSSVVNGTASRFTTLSLTVVKPDFGITESPSFLEVPLGSTKQANITITSMHTFSGVVKLNFTVSPLISNGPTITLKNSTFMGASVNVTLASGGTVNATLTVSSLSSTKTAAYAIEVRGFSGLSVFTLLKHNTNVTGSVAPFAISVSPANIALPAGSNATSIISLTNLATYFVNANLNASVSSPVTNGPSVALRNSTSFIGPSIIVKLAASGTNTATLYLNTTSITPAGIYNVTITGANGTATRSIIVSLSVVPFTIVSSPGSLIISRGSFGISNVALSSINSFVGSATVTASVTPVVSNGPTAALTNSSFTGSNLVVKLTGGTSSISLNVSTILTTPTMPYTVTLTATTSTSGKAESLTTNVTITVTPPVPDFTISTRPSSLVIPVGSTGTSTITLKSVLGFTGKLNVSVTLSPIVANGPSVQLTNSSGFSGARVTVTLLPGGTVTVTLSVSTTPPTPTQSYTANLVVTNGTLQKSLPVSVNVVDFGISGNPPSLIFTAGSSRSSTVSLSSINGFTGNVTVTATVSPSVMNAPSATLRNSSFTGSLVLVKLTGTTTQLTLNVTTTALTQPMAYSVMLTASSGGLTHMLTVPVTITADFGISASPKTLSFLLGGSGTSAIGLQSLGFSGTLTVSALVSPSGTNPPSVLLSNSTVTGASSFRVHLSLGQASSATLSVTTASSTPAGVYTITITGANGSLQHTAIVSVNVESFSITPNPISLSFTTGSSGTSTITLNSIGLTGNVNVTAIIAPIVVNGPSATLTNSTFTGTSVVVKLGAGGTNAATLSVITSASTPVRSYTVIITGTVGSLQQSVQVSISVSASFTITNTPLRPSSIIVGESSGANITLTSIGLNGIVTLAASVSPTLKNGPSALLANSTTAAASVFVSLTPGSTSIVVLTIVSNASSTIPTTYAINVTASSGAVSKSFVVTVTLSPVPSITGVTFSPTGTATIGQVVTVTVIVANSGTATANFTIRVRWGGATVAQMNETLAPGPPKSFTLTWDTTGSTAATDTISVVILHDGSWNSSFTSSSYALTSNPAPFFTSTMIAVIGGVIVAAVIALVTFLLLRSRRKVSAE